MAQTEDTELRDLVIDALEKNGSLAKIRALLRANIFLAFEDECENMRHNVSLDNVLKVPEGIYALSIVHEFLEFCNLKNTLFVYKSESRQGKDYKCDGKKFLFDKLNFNKLEIGKEPVLITLIKNAMKLNFKNLSDNSILKKLQDCGDVYKDEQNSSYIVHEDSQSSATSTSQSDNSMDEKNKLHLRLHLDNSDTDTSSDSSRGKSASEYIPSEHIVKAQNSNSSPKAPVNNIKESLPQRQELSLPPYFTKPAGNTSSESTSYAELKPFSSIDEKMLNTSGLPNTEINDQSEEQIFKNHRDNSKSDSPKSATLSSVSSLSLKNDKQKSDKVKKSSQESAKSDGDTADYSFDFSTSQGSRNKENSDKRKSSDSIKDFVNEVNKSSPIESPHQNSHSSVSISDVADLISDKSSSLDHHSSKEKSLSDKSNIMSSNHSKKKSVNIMNKLNSDDSGDFTESPVPSLSNLSLDIHSD